MNKLNETGVTLSSHFAQNASAKCVRLTIYFAVDECPDKSFIQNERGTRLSRSQRDITRHRC